MTKARNITAIMFSEIWTAFDAVVDANLYTAVHVRIYYDGSGGIYADPTPGPSGPSSGPASNVRSIIAWSFSNGESTDSNIRKIRMRTAEIQTIAARREALIVQRNELESKIQEVQKEIERLEKI